MASEAEVDLVINAAGALPEVERDLSRIISIAERNADDIDVQAAVNVRDSLDAIDRDLDQVLRRAEDGAEGIDVVAVLDQLRTIRALRSDLNTVITQADNQVPDIDLTAVLNRTRSLRNVRRGLDEVANTARRTLPDIDVDVDVDRDSIGDASRLLSGLGRTALRTSQGLGILVASSAALGVALNALAPIVVGVATAAAQIAPAAAIGVSGMATMQLAAGTLKLAMVGVEDAITSAFDPEVKPEDLAEQMKRLAPEARKFVEELVDMRKELRDIQQRVQNNFFRGFDDALKELSGSVGPAFTRALDQSSRSLNRMALGAADAADTLGDNGTLGRALDSSTASMQALERVPGQIVLGLGQLAAAAGPSMERLARAVRSKADEISGRLSAAFESGRLEDAIDKAVDTIAQFGRSVGNILSGLGNIFRGLTSDGGGLFDTLEKISEAFEKLTASREFQSILTELSSTADVLVANVLPLLREAFAQLAPVIEELGPPVRDFIKQVGPELIPVLKELGPILVDIAKILRDQMPFAIEFTKAALQALSLILNLFHRLLSNVVAPAVRLVARILNSEYVDAIAAASRLTFDKIQVIVRKFEDFRSTVSRAIGLAKDNLGSFTVAVANFAGNIFQAIGNVIRIFTDMPGQIRRAVGNLGGLLLDAGRQAVQGFINGLLQKLAELESVARKIADVVRRGVTATLGIFSPSRVFIEIGENTVAGFVKGLEKSLPDLQVQAQRMGLTVAGAPSTRAAPVILPARREEPPVFYVSIGNERLRAFVDTRVGMAQRGREAQLVKGVRR